ncbi:hypothetical protein [Amedibacillus sp. YH-ame10]
MRKFMICFSCFFLFVTLAACKSRADIDEEKQYKKQAEENAITYIKEKYDIDATVKKINLGRIDTSPIPDFDPKLDGSAYLDMLYKGKEFKVAIEGDKKSYNGCDNYQLEDIKDAILNQLTQELNSDVYESILVFEEYEVNNQYIPRNMFPKNMVLKNNNLKEFLSEITMVGIFFSEDAPSLEPIKKVSFLNQRHQMAVFNYKPYFNSTGTNYDAPDYSQMEFMYRDLQLAKAIDLKESILWMDNTFHETKYEPKYIGNAICFTFDREWNARDTLATYDVTIGDRSLFKDLEEFREFEIISPCVSLTRESNGNYTVVYIPQEDFLPQTIDDNDNRQIELIYSEFNGERHKSSDDLSTTTTNTSKYYDNNGNTYLRVMPTEKNITFCYATVGIKDN